MSRLDDLPPDQRAVLLLLVQQGKSHAEIADMLGISSDAVAERAQAALGALADSSPVDVSPEIPSSSPRAPTRKRRDSRGAATPGATTTPPSSPRSAPTRATSAHQTTSLPVSRRGGALLLAVLAVVIVAVILLTSGGGSHKGTGATTGAGTGAGSTSSTSTTTGSSKKGGPKVDSQFALTSPESSSKAIGLVEVVSEGTKRAFYIAAEHLPASTGFFYAVWLYNSATSAEALSKGPTVSSNGRLQGGALLPANAGSYHKMLLTRETSSDPTHPGPIVLSGTFSLGH